MARVVAVLLFTILWLDPPLAVSGEPGQCVIFLGTEKKTGMTCSPGARQVFFTHIENACERSVLVLSQTIFNGKALISRAEFPAGSTNFFVGCGVPDEPIGWCYEQEFQEKQCSHEMPRAFNKR
jgi:hypothetical protein